MGKQKRWAPTSKESECPLTEELAKEMWYINKMEMLLSHRKE